MNILYGFIAVDFYDLGTSIFTESVLRFLEKNIIYDKVFFKKCNADF